MLFNEGENTTMGKITAIVYGFSLKAIQYISFVLLGLLFISSFIFTCYALDMESQLVLKQVDNIFLSVIFLLLGIGIMALIVKWVSYNPINRKRILLCFVIFWCLIVGVILIIFSKTVPAADAMSVYSIAESLANGNMGVIHPTDSYLSYYPQQIGLVGFYELIIRFFGFLPESIKLYHILKCINVFLCCVIIYFTYLSIHLLFDNDNVDSCYLVLAGTNMPLFFYTSFVYGEIPSFAFFTIGLWALLKIIKNKINSSHKSLIANAVLSVLAFTCSVLCRKNTLILIIAICLVLVFYWLKSKRYSLILLAFIFSVCSILVLPTIQKYYEVRSENTLKSGVPAISYFAMGMQESSRGNGWYNGFNFNTYQETGMDSQATAVLSKEAIAQRIDYFKENPSYMGSFYYNKFLSQWADGTYACRQATLATFGGRSGFFNELHEGRYSKIFINYCNGYQNILYLGSFVFCFMALKKKTSFAIKGLPLYIGLIGVIGGFLFHMVWEANSRYIFTYGLLLLPYCAWGCNYLMEQFIFPNLRFLKARESLPR